jgi:uncharacterized protein YkwD
MRPIRGASCRPNRSPHYQCAFVVRSTPGIHASNTSAAHPYRDRPLAAAINVTRKHYGLRSLRPVPGLMLSSGKHSLQMACRGYFSHSSVNGASFITRVKSVYGSGASSYFSAGENLLWAQPRVTPRQVVKRWLASPGHRQVLLSPLWRVFGVGVVSSTHGAGVFAGRAVLLVTADFAVKR